MHKTDPTLALSVGQFTRRRVIQLGLSCCMGLSVLSTALWAPQAVAAPPSSPTGQVVMGLSQEPTILHPLISSIEADHGVWWNLYDPLWAPDEKGNFVPRLAVEVPTVENGGISEDGLTWRVKLRDDVVWHDGEPFTAADVKYTLDLINQEGFNTRTRQGHELIEKVEIINDHEIMWTMKELYAPYISQLSSTFMVPKHVLEKDADPNASSLSQKPIGTGPFKFDSRVPGDRVVLVANEQYYGDGPYLERLEFKYIPDMNGLYTQFRTGQVDAVGIQGIPHNFYDEIKDVPELDVRVVPIASIEGIAINHEHPILSEKAVRQALFHAINRDAIVELIYYGLPETTESFLPKTSWAYADDLPAQEYDLEKAAQLLDDAGWTMGADGIREKDGKKLSFIVATTSGNELRAQTQQLIQQDWKNIGVELKINNMPAAVMWGDHWFKSQFESVLVSVNYMTGNDPDANYRFNSRAIPAQGGSGSNVGQYKNPEADALLEKGRKTMDLEGRKKIYHDLQHVLREDLAILPLYQTVHVEGTKKGLEGFTPNVNVLSNAWNAGSWYWDK
ncbi:peptide ABC transporter substrate-binding protein [Paenalcaligenes sp. Me131]|uniref:peptide ABC transporter substrate-binding protein n=1 Tax=Paenalcaligenes sp. Me131 TaxID=3392636 RepID=UPI003D29F22A